MVTREATCIYHVCNNCASFHSWWKENLVKHERVSKYYENDCSSFLFGTFCRSRSGCLKKQEKTLSRLVQKRFSFTHIQNTLVGNILISEKLTIFWYLKFEFEKKLNKLNRCAKILINQPNASIFLVWACLHKAANQLFVAL